MPRATWRRLVAYGSPALLLLLLVVLVIVVGKPFALNLSPPRTTSNAAPLAGGASDDAAADSAPDRRATLTSAAAEAASRPAPPPKLLPETASAVSLARTTANDYRQRARHPRWSQPLPEGEDPLLRDRQVSPVTSAGAGGAEPILTVFPDRVSFESPEPVLLLAYLSVGSERVGAAEIRGAVLTEDLQPIGELNYRDDGGGGDRIAGDLLYTALFPLATSIARVPTASYLVKVRALTLEQEERLAATGFLYSTPDAQLTGRYRDREDKGDLVIEAEIEASDTGRFHLEATLYGRDGNRPIAWAQEAQELPAGRHWMSLRFHGLILRERQIDGPYLLRFVALSTATQMPNAKNTLVENAYVTGAYTAASFSDTPFDDPDLLDAADRIERAIDGLRVEVEG